MRAILLFPLTIVYYLINIFWEIYWRNKESVRVKAKVISVGNIAVGGAGKTSIAGYIALRLLKRGLKVALVARGYGRPEKGLVVVRSGDKIDWRKCGDEPAQLARTIKGLSIYVDSNKTTAAIKAANDGFGYIIIDDGFQHRELYRDIDIVCLDGKRPFGNGLLLPSGILREPRRSLKRADMIVLMDEVFGKQSLQLNCPAPIIRATKIIVGMRSIEGMAVNLEGQKVIGFCGLGNPESFQSSLRKYGCEIVEFLKYPDHHIYDQADIFKIARTVYARNAIGAVTTLKDFVKLEQLWPADIALHYLEIAIELDNENEFHKLIGL